MVVLLVEDYDQTTILENALIKANVDYGITIGSSYLGVKPPCLIVDDVPLDLSRAMKWIKENSNEGTRLVGRR